MNGEIPSVPITTLAGIASLTDLLPELPLPSPLPSSVANKSLLFHPRVAEEARRLLNLRDEPLANQLVNALAQTNIDHVELKDSYVGSDCIEGELPELLKAILQRNPQTLKGFNIHSVSNRHPMPPTATTLVPFFPSHPSNYSQHSPYPAHLSPYTSQISPPRYTPQGSPIKFPQDSPDARPRSTSQINGSTPIPTPPTVKQEPISPVAQTRSKSRGNSPAQAVPSVPCTQPSVLNSECDKKLLPLLLPPPQPHPVTKRKPSLTEPVVVLNKLTIEEQVLAQKSVREFSLKTPVPPAGNIVGNCKAQASPRNRRQSFGSDRSSRPTLESSSGSDSSDEPLLGKKRKDKQRSKDLNSRSRVSDKSLIKRQRSSDDHPFEVENSFDSRLDSVVSSLTQRVKRCKRSSTQKSYVESPDNSDAEQGVEHSGREFPVLTSPGSPVTPSQKRKLVKKEKVRKKTALDEDLTTDELMETNTFKRFTSCLEMIFDSSEELDFTIELDEDAEVPPEALIPKYQLSELCSEAAKLKALGAVEQIPTDRLVRLLNILERNIRDGAKLLPIQNTDEQDEEEGKLWLELAMERVTRSIDASLTAIYIMTSRNMPKQVYLEDVIERVIAFAKYQLQNTIFPVFDPVYRLDPKSKDGYVGNIKQKRARAKEVKQKTVLQLYNKLNELVALLAELLNIQAMTDTTVLAVSTLGVSPFFVESVSELQLSALRLVTTVFAKYEKHRQLILEDILASLARLPTSKRSLRNYRLNSEEYIQMVTALILQLIQCVVHLPKCEEDTCSVRPPTPIDKKLKVRPEDIKKNEKVEVDKDVLIVTSYETAMRTAHNFLSVFLKKCSNKNEELDYRPLFENFVQDLLTTVNKPEWPAAELLLSLLGRLLVQNFSNKSLDMSLRVASLDYLGAVAARLRKDAVSSQLKEEALNEVIRQVTSEMSEDTLQMRNSKVKKPKPQESIDKTQVLQKALLDYLCSQMQSDPALQFAKQFYIAQWFRDANNEAVHDQKKDFHKTKSSDKQNKGSSPRERHGSGRTPNKFLKGVKKKRKRKIESSSEEEDDDEDEEEEENEDSEDDQQPNSRIPHSKEQDDQSADALRVAEMRKKFLLEIIKSDATISTTIMTNQRRSKIDYESAELIVRFLAAKRPFSQSFDIYLSQILRVLNESAIAVRTKAMKCLALVVEADPGILARADMQRGVHGRFLDQSTSVREAAVDLVGKFILIRPELTNQYYSMLIDRILDTGVSVRKRVIKILKDVCIEQPEFSKIPEICVKMIRRVNDEEGIKKLVNEVFQNLWFTPVKSRDVQNLLLRRVMNITEVVLACKDSGLDWFEQLLQNLLKQKDDKEDSAQIKQVLLSCRQIVDCLVQNVLLIEENALVDSNNSVGQVANQRLVACLTTLHLFAKIKPDFLVPHATTLQPYLSLKCNTQGDYLVLHNVAQTLELVVPLMEHPSETFLAQLEENMIKLILRHGMIVIKSCISCLGAVVNCVTHNYKLVRDCFQKFFVVLQKLKVEHEHNPSNPALAHHHPTLKRSLFTVGLFCRYFDFDAHDTGPSSQVPLKEKLFDSLMYFVHHQDEEVKFMALTGLGSMCIRYYDLMLGREVKSIYSSLLTNENSPVQLKCQVLKNIQTYLQEEEIRMIKQDSEWSKLSKKEDLKEMGDITSGMASTVIQIYLKHILESFLHPSVQVRMAVLSVIQLILSQGLVHPVQIVPYLICMSTDTEVSIRTKADQQLQEIEKKYPGFIQMKAIAGVKMSYRLQYIIEQGSNNIVRGFRLPVQQGDPPTSLNGYLYAVVRGSRQHRRAFVLALLKQFDEQVKSPLSELLYLADNLAYFPYQMQEEPLFLIHHIDVFISVTGSNLLQSFREMTSPSKPDPVINQEAECKVDSVTVRSCPLQTSSSVCQGSVGGHLTLDSPRRTVVSESDLNLKQKPLPIQQLTLLQGLTPEQDQLSVDCVDASKTALAIDDDEDEDVDTIMSRLPENIVPLQECMAASQGCLLLLVLKQHLKDMYGFTDGKIHRYSPAESAKVFEKSMNRKHVGTFNPKVTLERLKMDSPTETHTEEHKRNLVQQYLEFKELMLSIDRAEDEDDEDLKTSPSKVRVLSDASGGNKEEVVKSDGVVSVVGSTNLTNVNTRESTEVRTKHEGASHLMKRKQFGDVNKTKSKVRTPKLKEKPKKKVKKKRRRILDSEDDSDEGSDPDFMA